ncbi:hypothetical protein H2248_012359 [Termitomyces sp. 'cryptogamus']|nr:hypothetical protein H2248_012359 [Termitomyces sp. 'cryptogamus']
MQALESQIQVATKRVTTLFKESTEAHHGRRPQSGASKTTKMRDKSKTVFATKSLRDIPCGYISTRVPCAHTPRCRYNLDPHHMLPIIHNETQCPYGAYPMPGIPSSAPYYTHSSCTR